MQPRGRAIEAYNANPVPSIYWISNLVSVVMPSDGLCVRPPLSCGVCEASTQLWCV